MPSSRFNGSEINQWWALLGDDGKTRLIPKIEESIKIRGLGRFNPIDTLTSLDIGDEIMLAGKRSIVIEPRLPELILGMERRAQIILPKDAGFLVSSLGIGRNDTVLEAGTGSGSLALHALRSLGPNGHLITVEPRPEHAEVAARNISVSESCWVDGPRISCIDGCLPDALEHIDTPIFDAVLLDLPEPWLLVEAIRPRLAPGGRIGIYCPVTSQIEASWSAAEMAGLDVVWCGELIQRPWARAHRGGMRPANGPFGHTAFILIVRLGFGNDEEE